MENLTEAKRPRRNSLNEPSKPVKAGKRSNSSGPTVVSQIKACVRVRPLQPTELELINQNKAYDSIRVFQNTIQVVQKSETLEFEYDKVFRETSQLEVFESIGKQVVEDALRGFNGTVFAYGPTGSGKTFTMVGKSLWEVEQRGLVPRCASYIFNLLPPKTKVTCSILEIYREKLKDLLDLEDKDLKIKESSKGIFVEGLKEVEVTEESALIQAIESGINLRTVAATKINNLSSRSHCLFVIKVHQKLDNSFLNGTLNLIDLAGSEKVSKSEVSGSTFEDTKKINLSLSALGNVIHSLSNNCTHVPFRDSKLTRILQDSLGGNYKTYLVVNCSPFSRNIEETLSTLRFAERASQIKTRVKPNLSRAVPSLEEDIQRTKLELSKTKAELKRYSDVSSCSSEYESQDKLISELEDEVAKNQDNLTNMQAEILELEQKLASKTKNLLKEEISTKMINLKKMNEDRIAEHYQIKQSLLNRQTQEAERFFEYTQNLINQLEKEDFEKFLLNVSENQNIEETNHELSKQVKAIQWKILKLHSKNQILNCKSTHQQSQLKSFEKIAAKLRKYYKSSKS